MNKNLQIVFNYHEETKHHQHRYARSIGFMDWANQPNPYRTYKNSLHVKLPLSFDNPTPPYHMIYEEALPPAPLMIHSISQLMQFSMGISAIKSNGMDEWALRCNASSGNLQPTESYLILPPLDDVNKQTTISHYDVENHGLEILKEMQSDIWEDLPQGAFFVALSSISYREVWKYGERAFRYVNLDAGHAIKSIQVSAKTLGWKYQVIHDVNSEDLAKILGLDKKENFSEHELPDMLLLVSPEICSTKIDFSKFFHDGDLKCIPNAIASTYQDWPLIDEIEEATLKNSNQIYNAVVQTPIQRKPTKEAKDVILKRRSAQMMDKDDNVISFENFKSILESTKESFSGTENRVNLVVFVHNVEGIKSGLYMFFRNIELLEDTKERMNSNFVWKKIDEDLYALSFGDFREIAKNISCNQAIASDGAFSLGMLSSYADEIIQGGAHTYKELYWECGAIGQQLYLEATSLSYQATGIGCYLDDMFHNLLGLKSNKFQSLYHFTIGKALVDTRVLSKKPYENR